VTLKGVGDLHDSKYDPYKSVSEAVTLGGGSQSTVRYTITTYPTDAFAQKYFTNSPKLTTLGIVLVVIFTAIVFAAYDYLVQKEQRFMNEAALKAATNQMQTEELLGMKRTFVRYISHEIRSPLNVVHAGLDLLQTELNPGAVATESTCELVGDMFSASESAILILGDLLLYENLDAGNFSLDLSVKRLEGLLTKTLKPLAMLAKKKGVEMVVVDHANVAGGKVTAGDDTTIINGYDFWLNVDAVKLEQVVRNLITNAVKFTPPGCSVTINISVIPERDTLQISVIDKGAGIAPENLPKVFGEFQQFDRNKLQVFVLFGGILFIILLN
jgi:signal transduction histidine kinase